MFSDCDKENLQVFLEGMVRLTHEYKQILYSQEYKRGRSIIQYINLLKHGDVIKLIRRLQSRTGMYNKVIQNTAAQKLCVEDYITSHRIAVYTSIFGAYDQHKEPIIKPDNIDYFIITDQEVERNSRWRIINPNDVIPKEITSPIERNRYTKMLPHKIFRDYDYSIYVDGNVFITSDLSILIRSLEEYPIAMHRHKNRNCVYEEIEACISKRKDNIERLIDHRRLLKSNGVPSHGGLLEATVIARKHSDKQCIDLMEKWWDEFLNYSKRDQISLIDCLWKSKIDINIVAQLGDNIMDNDNFIIIPHL